MSNYRLASPWKGQNGGEIEEKGESSTKKLEEKSFWNFWRWAAFICQSAAFTIIWKFNINPFEYSFMVFQLIINIESFETHPWADDCYPRLVFLS